MTRSIDARLTALEAKRHAAITGRVVQRWLAACRAGADVYERNRAAGPAWCAAAAERLRLADETLETYGDDD